ncbi:MAG: RNA methyltransferase [Haliscomenobacter sp.]|nr:RNA methyltransferase [Haliscomenobacter sp.]
MAFPAPVSIRYHPFKKKIREENFEQVKWCSDGVYLPERPIFTLDPTFHAGAYYVQEASSMLIEAAVRQLVDLKAPLRVLDLAAAPGGKSTLLASLISPDSLLVANEVIRNRYQTLRYNLTKWGLSNTMTSNHDSREFGGLEGWFDLVLLDAPCSGEGLFRKDPEAAREWSTDHVRFCASRQKRIFADAAGLVRPGGIVLYSTCTYNALENAGNVAWFCQEFGYDPIPLNFPGGWGIQAQEWGYQCFPHLVKGEGFFLAALRKQSGDSDKSGNLKPVRIPAWEPLAGKWMDMAKSCLEAPEAYTFYADGEGTIRAVPKALEEEVKTAAHALKRTHWGVEIGQIKGKDLIPSPALALSTAISSAFPFVEAGKQTALKFLKKEQVELPGAPNGWTLLRYQGLNLGWVKIMDRRTNNYYPKEWRILMEV